MRTGWWFRAHLQAAIWQPPTVFSGRKKPLYIWGWLAIIVMISDVRGKYPVYYFTYDRTYY